MQRPTRSSHTKTTRPERVDIRVGDLSTHPNRAAIQAVLDEPDPVNLVDPKKRIYWDDELLKRRPPRATRQDRQQEIRQSLAAIFDTRDRVSAALREGFISGAQGFVLQQVLWHWDQRVSWTTNCDRIAHMSWGARGGQSVDRYGGSPSRCVAPVLPPHWLPPGATGSLGNAAKGRRDESGPFARIEWASDHGPGLTWCRTRSSAGRFSRAGHGRQTRC